MLKLLFGAGTSNWNSKGWVNVDIRKINTVDVVCDLSKSLPWKDGEVDEIYAESVIEHIPMGENYSNTIVVLKEWNRILKKGSLLKLFVPDLNIVCETYKTNQDVAISYLYGKQNYSENTHIAGFSLSCIYKIFNKSNFEFVGHIKYEDKPYEIEISGRKI